MQDAFDTFSTEEKKSRLSGDQYSGAVNADMNSAAFQTHMDKFHAAQGHGYAAEQANHLYDKLTGKDAFVVGGDNAKDGADRLVNGIHIQTKYCQTAADSVAAAFNQGKYRYINLDGSPMQLEVPSDQYEKAVELMANRIRNGQVPGVTNPADAKDLVRRGQFTYKQTLNIVKFGTVESLTFDAVNGVIVSASAMGISALIAFAQSIWRGESSALAVENALCSGIQLGGIAFINTVVTSQLMRTALPKALVAPTKQITQMIGPKASASIANSLRDGANIYGAAAMNDVSKLLRGNLITAGIMVVVLSAQDIHNAFQGRISGKQLFKNVTISAGGIAGGTAGVLAGKYVLSLIVPGAGKIAGILVSLAGGAVGGSAGGSASRSVVGRFIEDDAVALTKMIEDSFCQQAQDYLLTQEEVDIVLEDLAQALQGETLLDMFASSDQKQFADDLVREQIERLICGRARVCIPADEEFVWGIGVLAEDASNGTGIFSMSSSEKVHPVEVGRQVTGCELSLHAARKAMYTAKQMNIAQKQGEYKLEKMRSGEQKFRSELGKLHTERKEIKDELAGLLRGNDK